MKLSMANDAFRCGLAATDVHDEPHDQAGEVEVSVEFSRDAYPNAELNFRNTHRWGSRLPPPMTFQERGSLLQDLRFVIAGAVIEEGGKA